MFRAYCLSSFFSCNNEKDAESASGVDKQPLVKEDSVSYTADSATLYSYIAYDQQLEGKRPIVLVIHEWWGLNDYIRDRAKQLAGMGYLAMAVDLYGDKKTGDDPKEALSLAVPFYQDPVMAKACMDAALSELKSHPQADTSKIVAIGYCFGGSMVLNYAKLGANIDGVVSFHGGLEGVPPRKDNLFAEILVCHGEADSFVPQQHVDMFKKQMDSVDASYTFKSYANAKHAFTNPQADEWDGKFKLGVAYNAAADSASWHDMKAFFNRVLN